MPIETEENTHTTRFVKDNERTFKKVKNAQTKKKDIYASQKSRELNGSIRFSLTLHSKTHSSSSKY